MEFWRPYFISALTGLLVGIERERAHPSQKALGVRTFLLLSLIGALAGGLGNFWLALVLAVFSLALIVLSYVFSSLSGDHDYGLTTEFAGMIIFTAGYASHQDPVITAIMGPLVALVLFSKRSLHGFTAKLESSELQAAILILLLAVTVTQFLSVEAIDPWGIFIPRKFGLIVLALALLEFVGYILNKILGEKRGSLLTGFLGGLVSSTAVLLSTVRQSTSPKANSRSLAATAIAAKLASLFELLVIVGALSQDLLRSLLPPILAGMTVGVIALFIFNLKAQDSSEGLHLRSPLEARGVLRLSVMLAGILMLVAAVQEWVGPRGTKILAVITGLFELQGFSLASSTLVARGHLSVNEATSSIVLAVTASLFAKIVLSWAVTRQSFSRDVTIVFALMATGIGLMVWC